MSFTINSDSFPKQGRQFMYKRNVDARSRNCFYLGKAIITNILRSRILSNPVYSAHTPYYIVVCGLSGCTTFFHIIS